MVTEVAYWVLGLLGSWKNFHLCWIMVRVMVMVRGVLGSIENGHGQCTNFEVGMSGGSSLYTPSLSFPSFSLVSSFSLFLPLFPFFPSFPLFFIFSLPSFFVFLHKHRIKALWNGLAYHRPAYHSTIQYLLLSHSHLILSFPKDGVCERFTA